MAGIVFLKTSDIDSVKEFYMNKIGMKLWLDQDACIILRSGNLILGFCKGKEPQTEGVITFFYESREGVDNMYELLGGENEPRENEEFRIYHFYAKDPEGRDVEFQTFLHPIDYKFH